MDAARGSPELHRGARSTFHFRVHDCVHLSSCNYSPSHDQGLDFTRVTAVNYLHISTCCNGSIISSTGIGIWGNYRKILCEVTPNNLQYLPLQDCSNRANLPYESLAAALKDVGHRTYKI